MTEDVYDSIRKIMEEQWEEAEAGMSWSESMFDHKWHEQYHAQSVKPENDSDDEKEDDEPSQPYPVDFQSAPAESPQPVEAPVGDAVAPSDVPRI